MKLDSNTSNFTPRLARKTGRPKTDMPCTFWSLPLAIDLKQRFKDVKVTSIALQISNPQALRTVSANYLLPDAKSESHGSIPTQIELDQTKKKEILDA